MYPSHVTQKIPFDKDTVGDRLQVGRGNFEYSHLHCYKFCAVNKRSFTNKGTVLI